LGETLVKLLPFIVSAVFVAVAVVLTMAVANSTTKQQNVTSTAGGGLHSADLMHLYEGNRRSDVKCLGCNTPLGEFDLRCSLAQHHVAQSGDAD
jgi:hypothetical protein